MLISFVIGILVVWMWILMSIYSLYIPFFANLWDIKNYNIAYYWALSSIERAELVLRYHQWWFEWTWWWNWSTNLWPDSDHKITNFTLLWWWNNWMRWNVESRTTTIPAANKWDVDMDLQGTWSSDYNKLEYDIANKLNLNLAIDTTSIAWNYYTWILDWIISDFATWANMIIYWQFRLPPKIASGFTNYQLADNEDLDWDFITNDVDILRWINWISADDSSQFTLLPKENIYNNGTEINYNLDTEIRESIINAWWNFEFGAYFNPVNTWSIEQTWQNVIPLNSPIAACQFNKLFNSSDPCFSTWININFVLANLLKSKDWDIYPFLEYKLQFPIEVPDRFFYVNWVWKVGDYQVNLLLKKPTMKWWSSTFTIAF